MHDFCVLAGYGAEAINPYLAFATLEQIRTENGLPLTAYDVQKNYLKAVGKGILKVMSKMGISTYQSYCGAQIFDAVGLESAFVDKYFTGTATTIEGADLLRDRRRGAGAPRPGLWRRPALSGNARCRRRLRLPAARRGACLDAADDRQAAARGARQFARRLQGLRQHHQRPERAAADDPRADEVQAGARRCRSTRSSRRRRSSSASPPGR